MSELPVIVWLILAGLGCLLATGVLGVLAARVRDQVQRHDQLVQVHQRRLDQG